MRCEVRLDRRTAECLPAAGDVRDVERQRQWLSGMEARWDAEPEAADRCTDADADPRHPRRVQRQLRQSENGRGSPRQRVSCQQGARRASHARERDPCPAQAALQGNDGLEAQPAGGAEPSGQELHADGAESGLDSRPDLHLDDGRLAVSCRGARSVQPGSGGLVLEAEDDRGHRDRCADHGVVPQEAGAGADPSL